MMLTSCISSKTIISNDGKACNCEKKIANSFFKDYSKILSSLENLFNNNKMIYYCNVVCNVKNNKGVYQFFINATHNNSANFFYFDGNDIIKINNDDYLKIEKILANDGFTSKEIAVCFEKMKSIIEYNKNKVFSF